jgi:pro-apoptotic serine protease NMA111
VIPRGDLQATFIFKGFDEVKRLGLQVETEAQIRAAQADSFHFNSNSSTISSTTKGTAAICSHNSDSISDSVLVAMSGLRSTGMLVVDSIVPGGPADGFLEPGDVLVKMDGQFVSDFLTMEEVLDSKVETTTDKKDKNTAAADTAAPSTTVSIEIERGGKPLQANLHIQDLHAVTPSRFLEIGGGSVHNLSYQQARNFRTPVNQVYVAETGYLLGKAGCPKHCIITAVAGEKTSNLDDFIDSMLKLKHGQRVPLEYFTFDERNRKKQTILHVDWVWYSTPIEWVRDNAEGVWHATTLCPESLKEKGVEATTTTSDGEGATGVVSSPSSSMPRSVPKIASPCIQGTCAGRPPRPPMSTVTASKQPAAPAVQQQQQQHHSSSLPLSTPRQHSVPEVATSHTLEKCQAGVTAQGEDGRLHLVNNEDNADTEGEDVTRTTTAATAANAVVVSDTLLEDFDNEEDAGEAWRTHLEERLRAAMVAVDVEIPLVGLADGVHSRAFSGTGIIVHFSQQLGVVLVDRNTVAIGLGDIMLSLGAYPAEIPARVRFLHPLHNFALLSFDPSELSSDAAAAIAAVRLRPSPPLRRGESVELVSLSKSLRILHRTSVVTNPAMAVSISQADVPRFRAVHEEVVKLDQDFGINYSGVLSDRTGGIRALWGSYSEQVDKEDTEWTAGLATAVFQPWIDALVARLDSGNSFPNTPSKFDPTAASLSLSSFSSDNNKLANAIPVGLPPSIRVLNAELEPLLLSKAAQFGLPSDWISRLMVLDKERRQVLRVRSTVAASHAREVLQDGDMVLAVDGQPVSCFGHVEKIISKVDEENDVDGENDKIFLPLPLTIFRGGEVLNVTVNLGVEDGLGTDRLVHWAGAQLQAPHRAVLECGFIPKEASGVYISRWHHGSPAHRFGLYALHWITEVNGEKTPDLDTFLAAVGRLDDGDAIRVKIQHYETMRVKVLTLKIDLRYWPTWELRLDAARGEWSRVEVGGEGKK